MANSGIRRGRGTNGSQFFITYTQTSSLDGLNPDGSPKDCAARGVSCHSVFGRVIQGMDVAESILPRDPQIAINPGVLESLVRPVPSARITYISSREANRAEPRTKAIYSPSGDQTGRP